MKTIKEHLETLPEPYRSQALENYNPRFLGDDPPQKFEQVSEALIYAFDWTESPEGEEYWDKYQDSLINQENLLPSEPKKSNRELAELIFESCAKTVFKTGSLDAKEIESILNQYR